MLQGVSSPEVSQCHRFLPQTLLILLSFQRFTQVMRDPQYAVLPYGYPSIAPHHFAHRGSNHLASKIRVRD